MNRRDPWPRFLLWLVPRADQRDLIRDDLAEELGRRRASGTGTTVWYMGAVLESVADWWLGALSWRSAAGRSRSRGSGLRSGGWLSDVRFAARMTRREKIVSGAVIVTIMLGVGSTTAVATLLRGVVMKPLPYPDPDNIVRMSRTSGGEASPWPVVGLPDLEDWRERSRTMSAVAGWSGGAATLTGFGQAERVRLARVTPDLDRVLGISPHVGRFFVGDDFEVAGGNVAVLGHAFWVDRFGADPSVVGSTIELDARALLIVGVLPPSDLPYPPDAEVWLPLAAAPDSWMRTVRGASWLNALGRVEPDVALETAGEELSGIQRNLVVEFPRENDGQDGVRLERLQDVIVGPARPAIRLMSATMGLVLLLASANVGMLLLARSNRRRQELSVRTVLGGERPRLARLILTEALVLAAIGGALGLPLAIPLIEAMVALYPGGLPRAAEVRIDAWVVAVSCLTMFLAGGLASLAPAASLRRIDLASQLRSRTGGEDRGQARVRSVLAGAQLALTVVLLVGASLLVGTLGNLRDADPGFEQDRVLTFHLAPAGNAYPEEADISAFYRSLLTSLETDPTIVSAGAVSFLPFTAGEWGGGFDVAGVTYEARVRQSWPGYYEALGLELVAGRPFDWRDDAEGTPVAMLNEAAARIAFAGENALGRTLEFDGVSREIVGVIRDVHHRSLVDPPAPEVHLPTAQVTRLDASVAVRTTGEPLSAVSLVRGAVAGLDPDVPVTGISTMGSRIEASLDSERFRAMLATGLAALAVLLALIGVYGVVSYGVAQRRREIGIRFALGESGTSICRRVLRSAATLGTVGVGIGVIVAWALSRLLASMLYGVSAQDPRVFLAVAIALLIAVTASALGPAIRASRLDPLMTIREE